MDESYGMPANPGDARVLEILVSRDRPIGDPELNVCLNIAGRIALLIGVRPLVFNPSRHSEYNYVLPKGGGVWSAVSVLQDDKKRFSLEGYQECMNGKK